MPRRLLLAVPLAIWPWSLAAIFLIALTSAPVFAADTARVDGQNIRIEFDGKMHSRVVAVLAGLESVIGDFSPSEFIRVSNRDFADFSLQSQKSGPIRDQLGAGSRTILTGIAPPLQKTVTVTVYDAFPRIAIFEVAYTNTASSDLSVSGWTNQHYSISASASSAQPAFWSYQSGSYEKRPDWVLPLKPGFKQENFLGMNASDYGGGTPVVDVWRRDAGIGVGHLEMAPKLVSLPVTEPGPDRATVAVEFQSESGAPARCDAQNISHFRRGPQRRLLSNVAGLPRADDCARHSF